MNVTQLTADRLRTVLDHALAHAVDVVALQETRHHDPPLPWAQNIAKGYQWNIRFSTPSPPDRLGRTTQGGTAILWRRTLGRCSPGENASGHAHQLQRTTTMHWPHFSLTSAYGPAYRPDKDWLHNALEPHHDRPTHQVFLGDLNWAPAYQSVVPKGWHTTSDAGTTVANTAPTLCFATTPVHLHAVIPAPGIPHHFMVVYDLPQVPQPAAPTPVRLTRCTVYEWGTNPPTDEQRETILTTASDLHPHAQHTTSSLYRRWQCWHRRAEAALVVAASMGLATRGGTAERPKGSMPTNKPTAPGPAHRPDGAP
jgi:hypothetical protein